MITLTDIRLDGGTQPRTAINEQVVAEYADAMRAGLVFPPLTVFFDGAEYWLADGFHRYHALKASGVAVDIDCRRGTRRDAVLFSVGANDAHGLRRTNDDKRKAVQTLLADAEWAAWSDRKIAEACAVSHPFVSGLRGVTGNVSSEKAEPARRVTTKHGTDTTMNTAGIAAANQQRAQLQPPTKPELIDDEGPSDEEIAEALKAEADDAEVVRLLLESDDKLAAMTEKCKQQAAQIRILEERVRGLTNEAGQAVRLAKSWRTKCEKMERAAA